MPIRVRRILVAIREERRPPRGALRKAAELASSSGARVELFHAINEPEALHTLRRGLVHGLPTKKIIDTVVQRAQGRLARLAALPEFAGLKVTGRASWDYPPHEAVIREALATGADLIVASVQPKIAAGRLLLANTDWELIRHSPCPVLMIKSPRAWRKRSVLAAIDPFHAHDKPAALDRRILEAGRYVAGELGSKLHVFHAYMPLTIVGPAPGGHALAISLPPETEELHGESIRKQVDRVVAKFSIAPARRHVEMGTVQGELVRVARETDASIVVTGAVSRSAWRRFVIGSTAERVLDQLASDLLIIKPRDFRTKVPRRTTPAWLEG
jgi:universal stress protein E